MLGNSIYVSKLGNDSTGQRQSPINEFLTITAALAVAQSGDVVFVNPGTYNESITIPSGVCIRGSSMFNTIISLTGIASNTTLVTINPNCSLEDVTLNMASTTDLTLTGVLFTSTSATNSKIKNCALTINNGSASTGANNVIGIYSNGSGIAPANFTNIENMTVSVTSIGTGIKRGILLDTTATTINVRTSVFTTSGGSNSIAAETNIASSILTMRNSICNGATADISQTLGTINVHSTQFTNSNTNGKNFTVVDTFPMVIAYSIPGSVSSASTKYMRYSDIPQTNESKQILYKQCTIRNLYINARVAPGSSISDVYTVRKNGVNTTLTATLTGTNTQTTNVANVITFNSGDQLSLMLVTGTGSIQADTTVTLEIY